MSEDSLIVTTLQALIEEENIRTSGARKRLGSFVPLAQSGIALLNTFVESIDRDHFMAAALMLSVQKSATLSFLSYVRGHTAQAEFNARQLIEFCALTAYMLAHPEEDVTTAGGEESGTFKSPKQVSKKAYKWLNEQQPHLSGLLKDAKDQINDTALHASLYLTHFTFDWESGDQNRDHFRGSFFDNIDEDVSRTYLMSLTQLIVVVVETVRVVAMQHGGLILSADTEAELHRLDRAINAHRAWLADRITI